jgi:hypothetical protein
VWPTESHFCKFLKAHDTSTFYKIIRIILKKFAHVLLIVWFVANILAAYGYLALALTDSYQIIGQTWAKDFLTKILAANSCQIFGRASVGTNQTHPY